MAIETFQVPCDCGATVAVGVHQCGLMTTCPACGKTFRVPDLKKLRAQSGDPYPTLAAIRKIQKAIADRLPPFDGRCVSCQQEATLEIPVLFGEIRERYVTDHGGFRIGMPGGKGAAEKGHGLEETEIPICLCEQCTAQFVSSRRRPEARWWKQAAWVIAAAVIVLFIFRSRTLAMIAGVACWFALRRSQRKWRTDLFSRENPHPRWLDQWIAKVRWFPEAVRDAMQYSLNVGAPRPLKRG
jgi:hypothetical protein